MPFFPSVNDAERGWICWHAEGLCNRGDKAGTGASGLGAVAKLNNKKVGRSIHGPLIEDIKEVLKDFHDLMIIRSNTCDT